MGGDQKSQMYSPTMEQLPYRTEGDGKQPATYSDDYTKTLFEDQKRKRDELMNALSRLGLVDQAMPQGMTPMIPYRPIEPQIGF